MHLSSYPIYADEGDRHFRFVSSGPKGEIEKEVVFTEGYIPGLYNLGFGDKVEGQDELDDFARTDNNDMPKVLATVATIAHNFLLQHHGAGVFATGSTDGRTRLYQIMISANLAWLNEDLNIFGFGAAGWEPFRKGIAYEAFYVVRKA